MLQCLKGNKETKNEEKTSPPHRLKAFTLSEVLITLVIIGVITAITIPLITPSWQKTRTVSALKKCYSTLAQTTDRAIADNGSIASWEVLDLTGREFAQQYLIPYLSVMNEKSSNKFEYTTLNKAGIERLRLYTFYLADGSKIGVGNPSESVWGIEASIYADINGDAKPNIMGKDVFRFIYWIKHNHTSYSGKFIPYGGGWSRNNLINTELPYGCRKDKTGGLCAALIMSDGWQIKSDYPW